MLLDFTTFLKMLILDLDSNVEVVMKYELLLVVKCETELVLESVVFQLYYC